MYLRYLMSDDNDDNDDNVHLLIKRKIDKINGFNFSLPLSNQIWFNHSNSAENIYYDVIISMTSSYYKINISH